MDKNDIVLATNDHQNEITVCDLEGWIKDKENHKDSLSNLIYDK